MACVLSSHPEKIAPGRFAKRPYEYPACNARRFPRFWQSPRRNYVEARNVGIFSLIAHRNFSLEIARIVESAAHYKRDIHMDASQIFQVQFFRVGWKGGKP